MRLIAFCNSGAEYHFPFPSPAVLHQFIGPPVECRATGFSTMPFTLSQAAVAAARSRSTILRAIQTGRLSAARDATTGSWAIEPAELFRVYPVADRHVLDSAPHPVEGGSDATALIAAKDALIAEQRAVIDDLRRRLDRADERLTVLLTDQRAATPAATAASRRAWWPWARALR